MFGLFYCFMKQKHKATFYLSIELCKWFSTNQKAHSFLFLYKIFKKKKTGVFSKLARKQLSPRKPYAPGKSAETNAIDRQNNIVGRIFGHIFVPKRNIIRGTSMFTTIEHMLRITPDLHLLVQVLYMARV